jgi:hypothetical protein
MACIAVGVLAGAVAGCTRETTPPPVPPTPPFKVVGSVRQIMLGVVIPTSNIVFAAAGEAPTDEATWGLVETNAITLAESGNLLMLQGRAVDEGEWRKHAQAMIATSEAALAAIRAKDVAKLTAAGDAIYEVCEACHKQYMPKP